MLLLMAAILLRLVLVLRKLERRVITEEGYKRATALSKEAHEKHCLRGVCE